MELNLHRRPIDAPSSARRRCVLKVWVAFVVLAVLLPARLAATDLRGRIVRNDAYRSGVPVEGVKVVLLNQAGQAAGSTVTGGDGFYYLYNINPGSYSVELTYSSPRSGRTVQRRVPITVENRQSQDIAQVVLSD